MISESKVYSWKGFRCAYEEYRPDIYSSQALSLLLLHPIGVGLSGQFWGRFAERWFAEGVSYSIYNPDLLGCGKSDMPRLAYETSDWANQLQHFIETEIGKPVVLVVQGALFPVAIALYQ